MPTKTKNQPLYKVVTSDLRSVTMTQYKTERHKKFQLQYSLTDFVFGPGDSRVFIFSNLQEAITFAYGNAGGLRNRIFEVEAIDVTRPKYMGDCDDPDTFWKNLPIFRKAKKAFELRNWADVIYSDSTRFARAVKLAREVKY